MAAAVFFNLVPIREVFAVIADAQEKVHKLPAELTDYRSRVSKLWILNWLLLVATNGRGGTSVGAAQAAVFATGRSPQRRRCRRAGGRRSSRRHIRANRKGAVLNRSYRLERGR
jgi:hypothetical protein